MKTYDAKEIIIIVGAHIVQSGRDSGEFLALSATNPEYTETLGADGELVLNRTNDRTRSATVTLMKSSLSNDFFSSLVAMDRRAPGGISYPFVVRHVGNTTILVAETAKIMETPGSNAAWGQELGTYQWVFKLSNVTEFYGGMFNNPLAPV